MSIAIENLEDKACLHEGIEVTYTVIEEVVHKADVLEQVVTTTSSVTMIPNGMVT